MEIKRCWSMPSCNTFSIKPIKNLINKELVNGIVLVEKDIIASMKV
ncbi:hypothetical protein [Clostridium perfringens]|nr:hypothetical protein [Clostridium perfringens]